MPFSIGWSELLIIGVIALIVIGPKDLPVVFRKLGQWMGKMRAMAREFQFAMNEAAEHSGLNDAKQQIKQATSLEGTGLDELRDTIDGYKSDINSLNPLSQDAPEKPKAKKAPKKTATPKATQKGSKKPTAKTASAKTTAAKTTAAAKTTSTAKTRKASTNKAKSKS